jgi:protein-tyrosine phosphatase
MIDIHCHILPWLDDGPDSLEESLRMAKVAAERGTETIIATPHLNDTWDYEPGMPEQLVRTVQALFDRSGILLNLELGAEVDISRVLELDDAALEAACLGSSRYVLLETPNHGTAAMIERTVFELQLRGVRVVLAHPERSPIYQTDLGALERLVERGVLVSVTGSAIRGRAGTTARAVALDLFELGLVHNVVSDGHSSTKRRPEMATFRAELETHFHDAQAAADWMTIDVPQAILADIDIPDAQFELKRRRRPARRRKQDALAA